MKSTGAVLLVILLLIVVPLSITKCKDEDETEAFEHQMKKDPNTWTDEETNRYEGFMDWLDKQ